MLNDGPPCCSGGDCCGPGSYCCARTGPHEHNECLCNIGVQECPTHPGRLNTKEQNIAFRKDWDSRVEP